MDCPCGAGGSVCVCVCVCDLREIMFVAQRMKYDYSTFQWDKGCSCSCRGVMLMFEMVIK